MNELAESVGTVTAIGMGTVFMCLILLYGVTSLLSVLVARATRPSPAATKPGAAVPREVVEPSAAAGPSRDAIVAAITLVLARARASRAGTTQNGPDSWRIAGRLRSHRSNH